MTEQELGGILIEFSLRSQMFIPNTTTPRTFRLHMFYSVLCLMFIRLYIVQVTREGFLRKNIVAVSFFQNCATHQYS